MSVLTHGPCNQLHHQLRWHTCFGSCRSLHRLLTSRPLCKTILDCKQQEQVTNAWDEILLLRHCKTTKDQYTD